MASRGSHPIRRPLRVPRLPAPKFPPVLSLAFAWTLLWAASAVATPLPPVPVPAANPITPQKAVLGKILFWDQQLSSDHTVACGSCHLTEFGGADPAVAWAPILRNRAGAGASREARPGKRRGGG